MLKENQFLFQRGREFLVREYFPKKRVPVYFYLVILKIGTTPRQGSNESTGK